MKGLRTRVLSAVAIVAASAVSMAFIAPAFACIPIAVLQLTPSEVAPGGTVKALIREVSGSQLPPVEFHFKTVDGPILATAQPGDNDTSATFQIPADTPAGDYLVIATEPLKTFNKGQFPTWGMPAKAVVHVITPLGSPQVFAGSAAVQTQTRAPGLLARSRSGLSGVTLALIGGAVMVVALLAVLLVAKLTKRPAAGASPGGP